MYVDSTTTVKYTINTLQHTNSHAKEVVIPVTGVSLFCPNADLY